MFEFALKKYINISETNQLREPSGSEYVECWAANNEIDNLMNDYKMLTNTVKM